MYTELLHYFGQASSKDDQYKDEKDYYGFGPARLIHIAVTPS
jgi:hypothetical protein